jgi:hypothetical protein
MHALDCTELLVPVSAAHCSLTDTTLLRMHAYNQHIIYRTYAVYINCKQLLLHLHVVHVEVCTDH